MKPFDWEDYLVFAEDLQKNRADDAALRSAVSRAYYTAYNLAVRFLENRHLAVKSFGNKHEAVWNEFQRGPGKDWKAVYKIGDSLKKRRVDADYFLTQKKWTEEVKVAIAEAKNIQHWLRQIASQQPPTSAKLAG